MREKTESENLRQETLLYSMQFKLKQNICGPTYFFSQLLNQVQLLGAFSGSKLVLAPPPDEK